MQPLAACGPADSIIVEEAPSSRGRRCTISCRSSSPTAFYTCASGGLGHGLPAAVGVALGRRRREGDRPARRRLEHVRDPGPVVGGAAAATRSASSSSTTAAMRRSIGFARHFGLDKPVGTRLLALDFVSLARAQGCDGVRVERSQDLPGVLRDALQSKGHTRGSGRGDDGIEATYITNAGSLSGKTCIAL